MSAKTQTIAALVISALIFLAGWTVQGWRSDSAAALRETGIAQQAAGAAAENAETLADAQTRAASLETMLAQTRITLQTFAEEKNREIENLVSDRRCLGSGAVRVLNRTAPAPTELHRAEAAAAGVALQPTAAAAAGADDGPFATERDVAGWINNAQQRYDACRADRDAIRLFYSEGKGQLSDIIDRAQEREEEMRQDALADRARQAQNEAGDSAEFCAMCGEPIPELRREYVPGVQTCVECQSDIERLGMSLRRG